MASSRVLPVFALVAACGSEPVTLEVADGGADVPGVDTAIADAPATDVATDVATDTEPPKPSKLRLLFIGNSYTFTNDIPKILRRISATAAAPPSIETDQVLVGGASLENHWETGDAQGKIDEKTWTHVVIQGQSLEPLYQPATFATHADLFATRATAAMATPTFYATWARAAGDPSYGQPWSGGSPDAMQDRLTKGYVDVAAKHTGAIVVKVGEAFRTSLKERPTLALHVADRSHPTLAGSYLSACTFYVKLTGSKVPPSSEVPAGLTAADATHLRSVADRTE